MARVAVLLLALSTTCSTTPVVRLDPEMMQSFKDMADPEAIKASLYWTMAIYAAMWLAPEPVFSKGLATVVTATFICYIGVDTFWTLIQGWRRLVEELDHATSFAAIREAGRSYGTVAVHGRPASRKSSTEPACR